MEFLRKIALMVHVLRNQQCENQLRIVLRMQRASVNVEHKFTSGVSIDTICAY